MIDSKFASSDVVIRSNLVPYQHTTAPPCARLHSLPQSLPPSLGHVLLLEPSPFQTSFVEICVRLCVSVASSFSLSQETFTVSCT
jgi:hypothetical protein